MTKGMIQSPKAEDPRNIEVSLLTGGADRPYAYGLATSLLACGASLDLVGNDELDCAELRAASNIRFLNLRGDQSPRASLPAKALRVFRYYLRLIRYTATARTALFHILWNNKFEYFDRTVLMLWYRFRRKRIILTLHNVNARRRDGKDSALNRLTLRIQYKLADHLFVHTEKMRRELIDEFGEEELRITVIPFGINNAVRITDLSAADARERIGIGSDDKAILFFGNITPYKGLEYLVRAFGNLVRRHSGYRLIIAGRPKNCPKYWSSLWNDIHSFAERGQIILRDEFIPDDETEVYFKGSDVLILPYRHVYQSGVLFLGYSFGLPAIAADVGSLRDEIAEGETGYIFRAEDAEDLERAIERYFASDLYHNLAGRRKDIREYAAQRNSWTVVAETTMKIYSNILRSGCAPIALNESRGTSAHAG